MKRPAASGRTILIGGEEPREPETLCACPCGCRALVSGDRPCAACAGGEHVTLPRRPEAHEPDPPPPDYPWKQGTRICRACGGVVAIDNRGPRPMRACDACEWRWEWDGKEWKAS